VGGSQYADGLRRAQCRIVHCLPTLEHQQPGGFVLGLAAVQRVARIRLGQGSGGAVAIVGGACLLAVCHLTAHHTLPGGAALGIVAALSAGLLLGTMYIPYRKAYISGMNPLSFVTVFTFGEWGRCAAWQ